MSTVRINDNIKEEVTPILNDLGISLSEAINMFLHQVKLNNGIPFNLKRKGIIELNDGYGSYIKINFDKIEKNIDKRTFSNVEELKKALAGE